MFLSKSNIDYMQKQRKNDEVIYHKLIQNIIQIRFIVMKTKKILIFFKSKTIIS